MNPISLLNNDMSTFMMSTQQVFQTWNDQVAEGFNKNCVARIQHDWNTYLTEMNARMNRFMKAEKTIDEEIAKYEREYKNR